MVSELVIYLESNSLMSDRQFGFRKCRSTEDQMLLVYSEIAELLNVILRLLSSVRSVSNGVPQESVLGSVLFLVYVNFLISGLPSNHGAFSDDCKIYLHYSRDAVQNGMTTLQRDLEQLAMVADSWNLSLNRSKCVMRFSRRFAGWNNIVSDFKYELGGAALEVVTHHRDLGVVVDRDLKFHNHVGELVHKAARLSSSLLRAAVNRSLEFMVTLFVTHIRPIIDYCSCVWNVGYGRNTSLIESVQRRWTKNIDELQDLTYNALLQY